MNWKLTSLETQNLANHHASKQFPILRSKQLNDDLIDYYLQYQSEDIKNLIKKFDFRYTDLEDEELATLIDMIIDSRDVYSRNKFDMAKQDRNFLSPWNPIQNIENSDLANALFISKTNRKNYLDNSKTLVSSEKWEMMMN